MGSLSVQQLPYASLLKNGLSNGSSTLPPPPGQKSCWSQREEDDLSSLLNGWKLDEPECDLHPGSTLAFWCAGCGRAVCQACLKDHPTAAPATANGVTPSTTSNGHLNDSGATLTHSLLPLHEATPAIQAAIEHESRSVTSLLSDVYNFERKQQDVMLRLIGALQAVKEELEVGLIKGGGLVSGGEMGEIHALLQSHHHSSTLTPLALHRSLLHHRQSLQSILSSSHLLLHPPLQPTPKSLAQLQLIHQFTTTRLTSSSSLALAKSPALGPRFYFDMELIGVGALGRVVIETRPDVAPRMCENFHALARGERGFGFEGCVVFQCWRGESVITGDFEHQNGRGGHSIFPSGLFMPEDTRLPATRGALGMRRTQKRHDSKGLVGSQFRIILQDMPGFTGIFGQVLEGIEVVERIAECGDASGNPTKRVVVRRCGEL